MSDPFISRREAIGIGKEWTAGSLVSASYRIPKKSGSVSPKYEVATDDSGYWNIDETFDTQTVKNSTELAMSGIIRDDFLGMLLLGAMWTRTSVMMTKPASVTGTPVKGDTCYQGANFAGATWTGKLMKILIIGANTYHFYSTLTGSFVTATDVKEPTSSPVWTAVAPDSATYTAVKAHMFTRANTNNHQTFTIYSEDPIQVSYATYCMIDNLTLSCQVGDYSMFDVTFKGKQLQTTTTQSPAYSDANPFLAKYASVKFGAEEKDLNGASAVVMQSFKLDIAKNLVDIQAFGSTDIDSIHNQQFTIAGDMESIFEDITLRDYVVNSTKKACRFSLVNTGVTALVTGVYPSMYVDLAKVGFSDWKKSDDLNGLTKQTLGFKGQYSNADAMTMEVLLLNDVASY